MSPAAWDDAWTADEPGMQSEEWHPAWAAAVFAVGGFVIGFLSAVLYVVWGLR